MEIKEIEVINEFRDYLDDYGIKETQITFEDVNDFLAGIYFDIFDNVESIEDLQLIETEIENIIYKNFNVYIND